MITDTMESIFVNAYNFLFEQASRIIGNLRKPRRSSNNLLLGYGSLPLSPSLHSDIILTPAERSKHLYVIGGTGCGKTKFLEGLIRQDIFQGNGFGVIDPHGDLVESILGFLADLFHERDINKDTFHVRGKHNFKMIARQALRRLVLADLSDSAYSPGFNPLEITDRDYSYQLVLELVDAFHKIWEDSWGPRLEECLRNSLLTLAENSFTLLEMPRLLNDPLFRTTVAENLTNQEVKDY